ncbi:MAG: DMT family transporter [Solimonas sp.]
MNNTSAAWRDGLIGVLIFSGSLPATRVALSGFDPGFLSGARAAIAGVLALLVLIVLRRPWPRRGEFAALFAVAAGVVIGFPLFSALALRHITSAQALVFIGLLPLTTAIFAVLRGGERPALPFWLFAAMGSALVLAFAAGRRGDSPSDAGETLAGDGWMLAAIVVCGFGYAEGARLSRRFGGWQTICWALVLVLPATLPFSLLTWPASTRDVALPAWLSLAYVSLFSMLIGFVFWYRGLALGGIATIGQLQLLQPMSGLLLAAALLGETVTAAMLATTLAVAFCVAAARRYATPRASPALLPSR